MSVGLTKEEELIGGPAGGASLSGHASAAESLCEQAKVGTAHMARQWQQPPGAKDCKNRALLT